MSHFFEHEGVRYTVRTLTQAREQQVINRAIDVLEAVAMQQGYDIENPNHLSSYPFSLQSAALTFARLTLATTIEGDPAHPVAETIFDYIDPSFFGRWALCIERNDDLYQKWQDAYNAANKAEDTPLPDSSDEKPQSE
jgi:hypothetical protein